MTTPLAPTLEANYAGGLAAAASFGHTAAAQFTVALAAAAGSTTAAATKTGTDQMGTISFTSAGTGQAAGAQYTVTFGTAYGAPPTVVQLQAQTAKAASLGLFISSITATGFTVSLATATAAADVVTLSFTVRP